MTEKELSVIELTEENIESMVYEIRGQRVMLDVDLARIYGYTTKRFNEQVKNNSNKFPIDFMFQLTIDEVWQLSRCQTGTTKNSMAESEESLRSKNMTIKNSGVESEKISRSQIVTAKNRDIDSEEALRCQNVTLKNSSMESEKTLWSKKSTLNKSGNLRGQHVKYLPYAFTEQGIYMLMTVLKGELAVKQSKALIRLFKRMKDYIVESNNLLTTRDILELSNQVHKNTMSIESLKRKDIALDKKLTKLMDNFIDSSKYKEFVFLSGEKLEADIAYQTIYSKAHKTIHIVDDYIDAKTLYLLRAANNNVDITIISDNKAKNSLTPNFVNDFRNKCSNSFELIKTNGKCHDRLIFIDYKCENEKIYICGSSSKDAGNKATTIVETTTNYIYYPLLESLLNNEELVLL